MLIVSWTWPFGVHALAEAELRGASRPCPTRARRPGPVRGRTRGCAVRARRCRCPACAEHVRQQRARRPCPDDHHWNLHRVAIPLFRRLCPTVRRIVDNLVLPTRYCRPGDHRLSRALHDDAARGRRSGATPRWQRSEATRRTSVRRARSTCPTTRSGPAWSPPNCGSSATVAPTSRSCSRHGRAGWATTSATNTPRRSGRNTRTSCPSGVRPLPVELRAGVPAAAVAGRGHRRLGRRAASGASTRWDSSGAT